MDHAACSKSRECSKFSTSMRAWASASQIAYASRLLKDAYFCCSVVNSEQLSMYAICQDDLWLINGSSVKRVPGLLMLRTQTVQLVHPSISSLGKSCVRLNSPAHARQWCLMPEVADACCHQCHPVFVAALDHILVAHAAPRMCDGCDARLTGYLHRVAP